MAFVRAEREGEWALHLWAVSQMVPYFYAAGHINYARYGLVYLRSMEKLEGGILDRFMRGEHVTRHQRGLWNGMWTDMYIDTTYMRYGHGPGGIVGITLNEHALCRWALSLHICSRLTKDIADLKEATLVEVDHHKKESTSRIKADSDYRNAIRDKLEMCADPLDVSQGQNLINIVTGKISNTNVNVEDAVRIGEAQLQQFESACPAGFYQTIKRKVITKKEGKKKRGADPMEQCDSGLIFARMSALMSTRAINLNDVLKYELAAVPTSIFDEKIGELRISKSKSILKRRLQVEVTNLFSHREVPETLWLLMDVPYSGCSNGPTKDSPRMLC